MTKTFPILIDTWTEYERGWGSRPDGASIHLSVEDHKAFVDAFNKEHNNKASAPDEYTSADMQPKVIDVAESLYKRLVAVKHEGEFGMFLSRDAETLVRGGIDHFALKAQSFDVIMTNVSSMPVDPHGENVTFAVAQARVAVLTAARIQTKLIEHGVESNTDPGILYAPGTK